MFKINLLKWMPNNEQNVYERKLLKVLKELKIEKYYFNWDRTSCFIEFYYMESSYRLEHSIEKAKIKGILLKNGLDCLMELTQSLEDLCAIINRGTNNFETWMAGMKQSSPKQEIPEFQEEFQIRYKSLGKQNLTEYSKEFIPFTTESSTRDTDQTTKTRLFDDIVNKRP